MLTAPVLPNAPLLNAPLDIPMSPPRGVPFEDSAVPAVIKTPPPPPGPPPALMSTFPPMPAPESEPALKYKLPPAILVPPVPDPAMISISPEYVLEAPVEKTRFPDEPLVDFPVPRLTLPLTRLLAVDKEILPLPAFADEAPLTTETPPEIEETLLPAERERAPPAPRLLPTFNDIPPATPDEDAPVLN